MHAPAGRVDEGHLRSMTMTFLDWNDLRASRRATQRIPDHRRCSPGVRP
nr:hypothetical protein JVH1_6801 [Rhodococcus sp. JVH1]